MNPQTNELLTRLMVLIPMILSLSVHEWAHAWTAYKLGDDTAKHLGRLSLNPLVHIDPIGTLLLPLMGVPFGWAKPVPFNPLRFRKNVNIRWGAMLTALAGPVSNIILAVFCLVLLGVFLQFNLLAVENLKSLLALLQTMIVINFALAAFNMLPMPPLDGSHVINAFIPQALRPLWHKFVRLGVIPLIVLIVVSQATGISTVGWAIDLAQSLIMRVVQVAAG